MSEMVVASERDLAAEVYEQISKLPVDGQLRVLEFVWLNAASHGRAAQVGNVRGFADEREHQLSSLERMAAVVKEDVSGL